MMRVVGFEARYKSPNHPPVHWVKLAPAGEGFERTQTWQRVSKCKPPEHVDDATENSMSYQAMKARWSIIEPAYEAWLKGEAIPENGTPLAAWGGLNAQQVEILKRMGITTVEGVRDMNDGAISKMPFPDARKLPALAKSFLETASSAEKDAEMEAMREKMAAMEALLEEALAGKEPKRGPGRPKKEEAA